MPESPGTSRRWDSSPTPRARLGRATRAPPTRPASWAPRLRPRPEGSDPDLHRRWNERCKPFVWTKDADTILAKAQRPTTSLRYRDTRSDLSSEAQGPCTFENRPTRPRFQPEGEHRAGRRWQGLVGGAQSCLHRAASSGAAGPDRVAGRGRDGERGDRRSFGATGHCKVPLPVGDQRGLTCSCRGAAAWTSGGDARQRRTGRRRKTRRMRQS